MTPRVSIGLPVYNGEPFVSRAIEQLLAQSYADFELIICDNASTDGTEEISREFAARDDRVRYYRYTENVGAAPNFNRAFELSSGEYFKWAASDDECAPDFLTRCIEVLDNDPGVVLAYPQALIIDDASERVGPYALKLAMDSADPVARYRAMLRGHACYEVFGLIRREAVARTEVMGPYAYGDRVLLARLALMGRFFEIPEYLFFPRMHDRQSMTLVADRQRYAVWFDASLEGRRLYPHWRLYMELLRSIPTARGLSLYQRLRCLRATTRKAYSARAKLWADIDFHLRGGPNGAARRSTS